MKAFVSILFCVIFSGLAYAATGYGCAGNYEQARKFALADLSEQIKVRVESELYRVIRQSGETASDKTEYKVRVSSNTPLYGYKSFEYTESGMKCVRAELDKSAVGEYRLCIEDFLHGINENAEKATKSETDSLRIELLEKALTYYDDYDDHAAVLRFLGETPATPEYSRADIEAVIIRLQKISSDIPQIAANIKSQLKYKSYYAHPPKLADSSAVTPFASLLKQELGGAKSPELASMELFCTYDPAQDPFILGCKLTDKNGTHMDSAFTAVSAEVCGQVSCYQSANIRALEDAFRGKITPSDFYGYFYSNYGTEGLLLREGDVLRLYARASKPAQLMLVNIQSGGGWIIPLDKDKLAANAPDEITALYVTPPFGTESLVLFGYDGDISKIPVNGKKNESTGLIMLEGTPESVIASLRGSFRKAGGKYFEQSIILSTEAAK